jgi:seryl-tRNA synthetase
MLEIKFVIKNLSDVQAAMDARGQAADLGRLQKCDEERRTILLEIESLRHQRNMASDQIAKMKKAGEPADTPVTEMRAVSSRIKELEKELNLNREQLDAILLGLPNIPHASVPVGRNETDNPVIKTVGEIPDLSFDPQAHWDIGNILGILDFDRAAKIRRSPGAGSDQFHARFTHRCPWLYGDSAAFYCQSSEHDPYRPITKVRGRSFSNCEMGLLSDTDR